ALFSTPSRFQFASEGCMLPAPSVARTHSSCSPGVAFHIHDQARHAYSDGAPPRFVSDHVAPPSSLNSTLLIAARPDHARPTMSCRPGATNRVRVMKSGTPGGTISALGSIRVTGSPA